jgi:hypothetical protein
MTTLAHNFSTVLLQRRPNNGKGRGLPSLRQKSVNTNTIRNETFDLQRTQVPYPKQKARGQAVVTYTEDKKLGFYVPSLMIEHYETEESYVDTRGLFQLPLVQSGCELRDRPLAFHHHFSSASSQIAA